MTLTDYECYSDDEFPVSSDDLVSEMKVRLNFNNRWVGQNDHFWHEIIMQWSLITRIFPNAHSLTI